MHTITLPAKLFRALHANVLPADDVRFYLHGYLLDVDPTTQGLRLTATDGYGLMRTPVTLTTGDTTDFAPCIIPALAKPLPKTAVEVRITIHPGETRERETTIEAFNKKSAPVPLTRAGTKEIDGQYPDVDTVIPANNSTANAPGDDVSVNPCLLARTARELTNDDGFPAFVRVRYPEEKGLHSAWILNIRYHDDVLCLVMPARW